jgi:hypothetical protein
MQLCLHHPLDVLILQIKMFPSFLKLCELCFFHLLQRLWYDVRDRLHENSFSH